MASIIIHITKGSRSLPAHMVQVLDWGDSFLNMALQDSKTLDANVSR